MPNFYTLTFVQTKGRFPNDWEKAKLRLLDLKRTCLILLIGLIPFVTLKAQQKPNISYGQGNYNFTKGVAVIPIAAPNNSGGAIPAKIRGGVEDSYGLGGYNANRMTRNINNDVLSIVLGKNNLYRVDMYQRKVLDSIMNRDKPSGIVMTKRGDIYWTETGSFQIVSNPNKDDETSYLAGALSFGENLPKIGGAIGMFNNINSIYSYFSGGDDLLRKITGQEAKPNYILKFSGKIYRMIRGTTVPQLFLSDIQMPTGLAIDDNDNLYVSCFTADFTVKGGASFSGGEVEIVDDETGKYDAKIVKIAAGTKDMSDVGTWPGINYPTQLGIDAQGNITVMYHYGDNMVDIGIARIRKYPEGQTTGNTYASAKFLLKGSTTFGQAGAYQDMAVDGAGNLYLSDFYADRIMMLPITGSSASDLQVFSENVLSPNAMHIDKTTNQLWVKEGRYITTGTIKKLSLYGYSIKPNLPLGLTLNANGTITGTASGVSPNQQYTITASNSDGFAQTNINIEVKQIVAPSISYATNTYNLPIAQAATIPTPNNTGGAVTQQIGPLKTDKIYKGSTKIRGFAFDAQGNRYFCQPDSNRIMKVDVDGRSSVYLSGLNDPFDIEIDRSTGILYFTERNGLKLRAMYAGFNTPTTLLTGSVTSLAIDQNYLYASNPGTGEINKLNLKTNLFEKFATNVGPLMWISIYNNNIYGLTAQGVIKKVSISNPTSVTTVANLGGFGFELAIDDYGNIFAAGLEIYKIPAGTTTLQTYAVPNSNAWYYEGLGIDRDNNLYVTSTTYNYQNFEVIKVTAGGFTISPSLPAGLTFNNNGTITGTPTAITAIKDYTVKAINSVGESSTIVKIGVNNVPTTNLQYVFPATIHRTIALGEIMPTVTGGKPDNFSITPALPAGLAFDTSTGKISGTPSENRIATTYTITANNTAGNKTVTINFAVTEIPPSSLSYTMANNALQKDIAVNLNPTVTGGSTGVTYTINPTLPAGLNFSTSTGVISGTPTTITAQKSYTVTISNNGGSQQTSFNLSVKLDPPTNLAYAINNSLLRDVVLTAITPTYDGAGVSNFSITPTLPAGLNFNTTTGVISGKPTAASATKDYTVTATNLGGSTVVTFPLAVRVDAPSSLQYAIANSVLRNETFTTVTPTYSGSPASSFSISPTLPAGLSLNTTTGAISGTPTAIKAAQDYTVTAVNDGGNGTATFSLAVRVDAPTNLKYDFAHTNFLRNTAIPTVTPTYTGSPVTSFSVSPALPAGLTLNTSTGAISGTPNTLTAAQNYTVTATNDGGTGTAILSLLVTELAPTGLQYTFSNSSLLRDIAITAVRPSYGGGTATSFSISPALPAGLSLNTSTGVISGTPTVISGNTIYTVSAGNTAGNTTATFSLLVRVDAPTNLQYTITPSVLRDIAWSNKVPSYTGNSPIANFSISPALPTGLSFNTSTGVISGTPTVISVNKPYTVTATNDGGNATYSFNLAVRVDAPTNLRYEFRDTELQKDVAVFSVTPKYSGSPTNTFSINPSLPTGMVFDGSTGQISGTPTVLSPVTNYTVTATNDGGTGNVTFSLSVSRIPIPEITYATNKYTFTKGTPISSIPAPVNTGIVFPQQRIGEALYTGLSQPTGVATDAWGNTYIADHEGGNAKIKKLEKGGTEITDFVSSGLGTAVPYDLAVDVAGNVYVSVGTGIKKITPAKVVSDFATGLNNVGGLFIDGENDLYAAEYSAGQIIKFEDCNPAAKSIKITGLAINATTHVPAEYPRDIVVDSQKNIYVLQASSLQGKPSTFFTFIYKYFASDHYTGNTRERILGSVDYSSYMFIDKKNNLYINTDGNSAIILNNYIDKGSRIYTQAGAKMKGISLDAEQNAFYVLSGTNNALGKNSQFGYNTTGLPDGLVLNANGTITGTPTTVRSETTYTVSANSFYGKSNATLQIAVVDSVPKFEYAQPNQVLTVGVSNLNITPVKTAGPIGSYTVSPNTLPEGISFSTATGTFSGTPTKLQPEISTYVISATNTGGTGKDTVTFKINDVAPSALVYPSNYVLYLNKQFKGDAPTISGGAITKWSITPALPEGLYIDELTGIIQGYGNIISNAANYTVKAENSGGFVTATVNITIKNAPPSISYADERKFKFKKDQYINPIAAPDNIGGPIVSYSISGLPNGLTFNSTTGTISGKPTRLTSPTEYQVIADGGQWGKDTTSLTIEVISLPPNQIDYNSPITLVKGTAITNISPTYTSTGGDPVEQFTITPELPAGLTLNPTTGVISGTPTQILGSNGQLYYVTATNGAGSKSASLVFTLKDLPPAASYTTENVFTKGESASMEVTSTGGAITKYTISPALPVGLSIDSLSGKIEGTPSALTSRTKYTITASNYGNPASVVDVYLTIVDQKPMISYEAAHQLLRTVEITPITVSSTGGAVVSYQISPALPEGLTLNTTTGTISGTPTLSTIEKTYTVTATNTGGSITATMNIAVKNAKPVISYNSAYVFSKNVAVSDFEPQSTGGNQLTFTINPTTLPSGLTLNTQTGVISGTPIDTAVLSTYHVYATNDGGKDTATFTLKINEKIPGDISYAEITDDFYVGHAIAPLTPIIGADGGAIARFSISPANLAPGLTFNTQTGVLSGTPTSDFVRTSYTVTAHNSGGIKQTTITFAVIKLSATIAKTEVKCNGSATGSATVTVVGGKAPYSYTWSNGASGALVTGLAAGNYSVVIKDANQTSITRTILIEEPTALAITNIAKVDNQQNGGASGTATATVTGGVSPYTYSWSANSSTTATATGLSEGTYTLTITDANNCSVTKTVFIDAPPAVPTGLTAIAGNALNSLTWSASTATDLSGYKVYGGTSANPTTLLQVVTAPIVTYTHHNLNNGTPYYYRITTVDQGGFESTYSTEVTATPQGTQSISFAALPAKTYGDADFSAGATTSSGLSVTYTSDNPQVATIVAGKVHIVGAGTANITAAQSGNHTWLAAVSQTQQLTVNKRALTISVNAQDKTYDGVRNAQVSLSDNRVAGDEVNLAYTSALFNNKNVGAGKIVTVSGITISGTDAANYTHNASATTIADINVKALTITATAQNKVYDGNSNASVTLNDDRVSGDQLETSYTSASFNHKNVGTAKAVTVAGIRVNGTDAANYTINTSAATTGNITARALTVNASGNHKVYDGKVNATVNITDDRIAGDVINIQYTSATFADKNVGTAKEVTISGIQINGTDAANYTVNASANTTANITTRGLTVTTAANSKVYDGGFTAIVNLTDDRVNGDQLTAAYTMAMFGDKNVGTNKSVAVFGITISGTDAANYLVNTTANTSAAITAKALTVTAENKTTIQGLALPALTARYVGFINGEDSNSLTTLPVLNTNATSVSPQGDYPITVTGTTAQNYSITHVNGVLTVIPGTPTNLAFNPGMLLENSAAGATAGVLSSNAPDPNAVFTYSLVAGTGDVDNHKFTITGNNILTAAVFDYETQRSFNIRVRTTTQYGTSLEQTFVVNLTDVNEAPTLADIANQTICYTSAAQTVSLSGITAGPETDQNVTVSVTSDNSRLFNTLTAGNVNAGNALVNYRLASGQSGSATITVTITDNGGTANGGVNVISKTFNLVVNAMPEIEIQSDLGTSFAKGQTATLTATGGVAYQWSGPSGIIGDRNTATLKVRPEQANSTYTVTVTTAAGCTSTRQITLTTAEDIRQVTGTNVITPNGDGVNDNLIIKNVDLYPDNELEVFDRAGRKIYTKKGYQNEWNGTLNGTPLAEGTYYYIINFKNVGKYKGFITIIKD